MSSNIFKHRLNVYAFFIYKKGVQMTPENLATLIENKGVSLIITALVLYFMYKYFTNVLQNNAETTKEIVQELTKLNNFLINGYSRNDDFDLLVKIRGRYVILEYKWQIIKYILHNHIKENLNTIKFEMRNYIDKSSNRTIEIFSKKASPSEIQIKVDLINETLTELNTIILPIFVEMAKQTLSLDERIGIIRTIENHFDKIESEFLCKFNKNR